jgi:two-component system, chemotaxis family, CheB/CheR fusion protein
MAEAAAWPDGNEARLLSESIVDTVRQPLLILSEDLRVQSANRAFCDAFQLDRAQAEGRIVYDLGDGQWDIPELHRLLSQVLPADALFENFALEHDFPILGLRVMVLNARRVDRLHRIVLAIEDITERRRSAAERAMLVGELNHRVKNLFAIVRALATQANGGRTAGQYRQVFLGRVDALARTHDLLFASEWRGAELHSLVGALQPSDGERAAAIEIDGAWLELGARQALSVSLVLHELATNAAAYGALSVPEGRVRLSWQVEDGEGGRHIRLSWEEHGGPPVTPPRETGFGTQLIRRAFDYELDGTADLSFGPEGFRLEATFPSR